MKKVLLGLSGGVDSAVAAYILKEQGYDVTCCFMRNWDAYANNDILGNPTINNDVCPQEKDFHDAQKVSEQLGLDIERVDFIKEYWDNVFVYFIDEYKKGRTPNPDILCNKYIKFDAFYNFAMSKGYDYVATGHYAQVRNVNGHNQLLRGNDDNKDQTYFLCQITQESLDKTLFPIGNIEKSQVRKIAIDNNLYVAEKKDSTGICFIGERNFRDFLQNYIPAQEGNIIDIESKNILGKHQGVMYYTIGQRKGLGIGGTKGPWFVIGKNVDKKELYVSNVDEKGWLTSNSCIVEGVNWFIDVKLQDTIKATAKFRYRQKDENVIIEVIAENKVKVTYEQGVNAVTCGQEAVFYNGEICIGGGVIEEVFVNNKNIEEKIEEYLNV